MGARDPRIDAYIGRQRDFARPILSYLRDVIHEGCPDCEETLKWSSPSFTSNGLLCGFAAFREHVVFGFWKHELILGKRDERAAGSYGRITSLADLPPKRELLSMVKKARELNEQGVKVQRVAKARKPIRMPADLKAALAKSRKAEAAFDEFSPSHKREYLEWITDAKGEDTRKRRLAQAVEWIADGKPRNWKYM